MAESSCVACILPDLVVKMPALCKRAAAAE